MSKGIISQYFDLVGKRPSILRQISSLIGKRKPGFIRQYLNLVTGKNL